MIKKKNFNIAIVGLGNIGLSLFKHLNQNKSLLEEYSIAKGAIKLERDLMKAYGGWQDQIFSAYGGICDISFSNNDFFVSQIKPNKEAIDILIKKI